MKIDRDKGAVGVAGWRRGRCAASWLGGETPRERAGREERRVGGDVSESTREVP